MSAIIIGHSYVKTVQQYILQSKTSMLNLSQYTHVFFHGIGGLKMANLEDEIHMVSDLDCKLCILDIGSNYLCQSSKDVYKLADKLFDIASKIVCQCGVKVIIMQQFNRLRRSDPEVLMLK